MDQLSRLSKYFTEITNLINDHQSYSIVDHETYPNGGESYYLSDGSDMVIIDFDICNHTTDEDIFPYMLITEKQNQYMKQYHRLFRFLGYNQDDFNRYINLSRDLDVLTNNVVNDRADMAEASALEKKFETNFSNAYGSDSLKYLQREYGINDEDGNSFYFDFCVDTKTGKIAIEENGVSYHHPQIIGEERYRKQLHKQNTCLAWGMKLYRFSTEECQFEGRMEDDLHTYLGSDSSHFIENGILANREFQLYDHQKVELADLISKRQQGINTCLVVLPTAAGKSKIAELDMAHFAKEENGNKLRALILAPNRPIIDDWEKRIASSLPEYVDTIDIKTYSYMCRHYSTLPQDYYDYICVDEAHHAVAPTLKRVIQYFTPKFLLGMTATDQRMDNQKLESVFGTYNTNLTLEEAMKKGVVATAKVYRIESNIDLTKVRFNGQDYVNADLEKSIRVTSRNELIAKVLQEYFTEGQSANRQGVIFCANIKHTIEMAKVLNDFGLSAAAYNGQTKNKEQVLQDFKDHKIRFLCSCALISEGWDYPELGILVMARPTLSKVLYLQQIGRGLRKTSTKKDVYVIDVVDDYGTAVMPCSMHSIFHMANYVPFGEITRHYEVGDFVTIDGLNERVEKIIPVNIHSFAETYSDYLSKEQVAREYFVSTGTITNWIKSKKMSPSVTFGFGSKTIEMFSPEDVEKYRAELNIGIHDDSTIREDFFAFLEERSYSLSYKMIFILSFISCHNSNGEASINEVLDQYIDFYQKRIEADLPVDRTSCPYTLDYLKDNKKIKNNMLTNPFEKFERKRFFYYSKNLELIAMNHALYAALTQEDWKQIENQMKEDLDNYYTDLGGLV